MRERDIPQLEVSLAIRLLRHRGWVSIEILADVLKEMGPQAGLGGFLDLLQVGSPLPLSAERSALLVDRVLNQMRSLLSHGPDSRIDDGRLGRLALGKGWISSPMLESALLEQARLRRMGLRFRLGEVFVRLDHLTKRQVETLLEEQGALIKTCKSCRRVEKFSAQTCECGKPLFPGPTLGPVVTDRYLTAQTYS